jgi:hypothetical protein
VTLIDNSKLPDNTKSPLSPYVSRLNGLFFEYNKMSIVLHSCVLTDHPDIQAVKFHEPTFAHHRDSLNYTPTLREQPFTLPESFNK